jgi:hypothetical protein
MYSESQLLYWILDTGLQNYKNFEFPSGKAFKSTFLKHFPEKL